MQKLVVTGVDRTLGANLAVALAHRFDVLGLSAAAEPAHSLDFVTRSCDLADPTSLVEAIAEHAPEWVIHCGACAEASWETQSLWSASGDVAAPPNYAREVELARRLAEAAAQAGHHFTVISTDAVFAGPRLFHDENDPATAEGDLAESARQLEAALADTQTLIVRTCPYGWHPTGESLGWAERLWRALGDGERLAIDAERHATPILDVDLAESLEKAFHRGLAGVYHITGCERTSPYRFAVELATAAGLLAEARIEPQSATGAAAGVALGETSLNTRRARRHLKAPMPLLREGIERFVARAMSGENERTTSAASIGRRRPRRLTGQASGYDGCGTPSSS